MSTLKTNFTPCTTNTGSNLYVFCYGDDDGEDEDDEEDDEEGDKKDEGKN